MNKIILLIYISIISYIKSAGIYSCQSDYNCEICEEIDHAIPSYQCIQCKDGYFLKLSGSSSVTQQNYCTNDCGTGFYPAEEDLSPPDQLGRFIRICKPCNTNQIDLCLQPQRPSKKFILDNASNLQIIDDISCGIGYYKDDVLFCNKCIDGVDTCTKRDDATNCKAGYQKIEPINRCWQQTTAQVNLADAYFVQDITIYKQLSIGVKIQKNNVIIECQPNFYNDLVNFKCVQNCPINTLLQKNTVSDKYECIKFENQCNPSTLFLNPYAPTIPANPASSCGNTCPATFYKRQDSLSQNLCQKCSEGLCKTNTNCASSSNCEYCKVMIGNNIRLYLDKLDTLDIRCKIQCIYFNVEDQVTSTCIDCTIADANGVLCKTCKLNGIGNKICTSCPSNYYLDGADNLCKPQLGFSEDDFKLLDLTTTYPVSHPACLLGAGDPRCNVFGFMKIPCKYYEKKCHVLTNLVCIDKFTLSTSEKKCKLYCEPYELEFNNKCKITQPGDLCTKQLNDDITKCQLCKVGYYVSSDGSCQNVCPDPAHPDTQYFLDKDQVCYKPNELDRYSITKEGCLEYSSYPSLECKTCKEYRYIDSKTKCLTDQDIAQYPQMYKQIITTPQLSKFIQPCPYQCKSCNSDTQCIECYKPYVLQDDLCILKCKDTTYLDSGTNTCKSCSFNINGCKKCILNRQNDVQCLQCESTHTLDQISFKCVLRTAPTPCQDGFYLLDVLGDASQFVCAICHYSCTKCSAINNCSECTSGFLKQDNSCVETCDVSYYQNVQDIMKVNECSKCNVLIDNFCDECYETATDKVCTKCRAPNQYFDIQTKKCVDQTTCEAGQLKYISEQYCKQCKKPCSKCNDQYKCTECIANYSLIPATSSCTLLCPNGFFTKNGVCTKCMDHCRICDEETKCQLCDSNYILNGVKVCIDENSNPCAIGQYYDPISKECVNCNSKTTCKLCELKNDTLTCTECETGSSLYQGVCLKSGNCPPNTYEDNKKCVNCKGSCKQCDATGNCIDCFGGYYKDNNQCLPSCSAIQYYDQSQTCTQCDNTNNIICSKHPLINSSVLQQLDCKAANKSLFYDSNTKLYQCISQTTQFCAPNETRENNPYFCVKCPEAYEVCSTENSQVISCKAGYFKAKNNSCVTRCDVGQFEDADTRQCLDCLEGCSRCYKFKNKVSNAMQIICTICKKDYFYDEMNSQNRCQKQIQCSPSFYLDILTNICKPCHPNCKECSGGKDTDCVSCFGSLFLKTDNISKIKTCVSQCGDYYYADNQICVSCPINCKSCSSPTLCTKCLDNNNYFIRVEYKTDPVTSKLSYEMACISKGQLCQTNYYLYQSTDYMYCKKCKFPCLECTTSSIPGQEDNCLKCDSNYLLTTGKCLLNCPPNYYFDKTTPTNNVCKKCNSNCKTCYDRSDFCTSCYPNTFLNKDNVCQNQTCDRGYFRNYSNNTCQKCQSPCSNSCISLDKCLECDSTSPQGTPFYSYKPIESLEYVFCLKICPDSYYHKNNMCIKCQGGNCSYCNEDNTYCKKCDDQYGLQVISPVNFNDEIKGQCKNVCTDEKLCSYQYEYAVKLYQTTYESPQLVWRWFYTCPHPCLKCYGVDNKLCLSCLDGYYLNNKSCSQCDPQCRKCNSKNFCTECTLGYFLQGGQCVSKCNDTTYGNYKTKLCEPCDNSYCQYCKVNSLNINNSCTQCDNQGYLFQQENKCQSLEQQGFFMTTSNISKIYQSCHKFCKKCFKNADQCDECKPGYFQYQNKCYEWNKCPPGTYASNFGDPKNKCEICPPNKNCAECNGISPDNIYCLKCIDKYYLNHDLTCKQECDYGYVDPINRICQDNPRICNIKCLVCSDSNTCLKCKKGYFLTDKLCDSYCQKGYYEDIDSRTCKKCDNSCSSCYGPSSSECRSCNSPYFLKDSKQCQLSCDAQIKYFEQRICVTECPLGAYKYTSADLTESICYEDCYNNDKNLKMYGFFDISGSENKSKCLTKQDCIDKNIGNTGVQQQNYVIDQQQNLCYKGKCSEKYFEDENYTCVDNCNNNLFNNPFTRKCVKICEASDLSGSSPNNLWGFQFNSSTRICVVSCPNTYYKSISNRMCLKDCPNDYPYKQDDKKECVKLCLPPLYSLYENKTCYQSCPQIGGVKYYADKKNPNNYVCVTENLCSLKTYPNFLTQQCEDCHIYCKKCDGPSKEQCSECNDQYVKLAPSSCREYCPRGYFQTDKNICQECEQGCQSCTNQECQQCRFGYFYLNGKCYENCPENMYGETVSQIGVCLPCHKDCKTCSDGFSSSCLSCNNDNLSNPPQNFYLHLGRCLTKCPTEGFYLDSILMKCLPCPEFCITCTSAQICTSCRSDAYFWKDQGSCHLNCPSPSLGNSLTKECIKSCNTGYYGDPVTRICVIQCVDPYWANNKTTECVQDCPIGTFKQYLNRVCQPCNEACDECTDSSDLKQCTKCALGYYKDDENKNNSLCQKTCPTGQYKNNYTRTCQKYFTYQIIKIKENINKDSFKLVFNYPVNQDNIMKLIDLKMQYGIEGKDYTLQITKSDSLGNEYLIDINYLQNQVQNKLLLEFKDQSYNSMNQEIAILEPGVKTNEIVELKGKNEVQFYDDQKSINYKNAILILSLLYLAFTLFNAIFDSINYISWNFIYSLQLISLLKYSAFNLHSNSYNIVYYIAQVVFIEFIPKGFIKLDNGYFEFYDRIIIDDQQPYNSFYFRDISASFIMNAINYIYILFIFATITGFIYFYSGGFSIEEDPSLLFNYRRIRYFFNCRQILERVHEVLFLPIIIYALLQLSNATFSNTFNSLSLIFSIISIVYYTIYLYKTFKNCLNYLSYDRESYQMIALYQDPINGDKDKTTPIKGCQLFIEYIMKLIMSISLVFLSSTNGNAQIGIIFGLIILYTLYLIIYRPYYNLFQNITVITSNIFVIIVYICSFLENKYFNDYSSGQSTSDSLDKYNTINDVFIAFIWLVISSYIIGSIIQKIIEFINFKNEYDDDWSIRAKNKFLLTFCKKNKDIQTYYDYRYNHHDQSIQQINNNAQENNDQIDQSQTHRTNYNNNNENQSQLMNNQSRRQEQSEQNQLKKSILKQKQNGNNNINNNNNNNNNNNTIQDILNTSTKGLQNGLMLTEQNLTTEQYQKTPMKRVQSKLQFENEKYENTNPYSIRQNDKTQNFLLDMNSSMKLDQSQQNFTKREESSKIQNSSSKVQLPFKVNNLENEGQQQPQQQQQQQQQQQLPQDQL